MTWHIRQIYLNNFKCISDMLLDFNDDVVILGGPNGYGKTTIFDALEICFTGRIFRHGEDFHTSGKETFTENVYANDKSKDVVIKVELYSKETKDNFTIVRKLSSTCREPTKNITFNCYIEPVFNKQLVISEGDQASQDAIEKRLGCLNLESFYRMHYYVQQEEKTHFLKNKEVDRAKKISALFGVEKQESEREILKVVKGKIDIRKDQLERDRVKLNDEIDKKKLEITELKKQNTVFNKLEIYEKLLPWLDTTKSWDEETPKITNSKIKDAYFSELTDLLFFSQNIAIFHAIQFNKKLDYMTSDENLKLVIVGSKLFAQFEEIKKIIQQKNQLNEIKEQTLALLKDITRDNLNKINPPNYQENKLLLEDEVRALTQEKAHLEKLFLQEETTASIIRSFSTARDNLWQEFNKTRSAIKDINENNCPFCGQVYRNYEELARQIDIKRAELSKLNGAISKEIQSVIMTISEKYLKKIIANIELQNIQYNISYELWNEIEKSAYNKERASLVLNYLEKELNLEVAQFIYNDISNPPSDLEKRMSDLKSIIMMQKKDIDPQINDSLLNENIYQDYFLSKDENVRVINQDIIDRKKKYIEQSYFNFIAADVVTKEKEIERKMEEYVSLSKWVPKYEHLKKMISDIEAIYKQQIKNYSDAVIKRIEIPFYIYSGKILQHFPNGLGILIKTTKKSSNQLYSIKFVSNTKNEHDALQNLSSGQLSGLILSFTLALNKVYRKSLSPIMIDDPVQTMDDINSVSFIDLIRNDFNNSQLIMSTHETDIVRFAKYNFNLAKMQCNDFNMKEELVRKS